MGRQPGELDRRPQAVVADAGAADPPVGDGRAVILSGGEPLAVSHFLVPGIHGGHAQPRLSAGATPAPAGQGVIAADLPTNLAELEAIAIQRALEQTGGVRAKAAKLLGISERTLRNRLNLPLTA